MRKSTNRKPLARRPITRALVGSSFEVTPRNFGKGPMLRISHETYDKLKKLAAYSNRSMANIIACAIDAIQLPVE